MRMNMYSFVIQGETVYIWAKSPEFAIAKARRFGRHFFQSTYLSNMRDVPVPSHEQITLANQINVVLNEPQHHPVQSFQGAEQALAAAFASEFAGV